MSSRVWWLTGKGKHPSASYLWCLFGLVSCEARCWGLPQNQQEDDTGSPDGFAFQEFHMQLKIVTGLSGLHWTVICRGHHLCVSEERNLVIFLCSLVTSAIMRVLDEEGSLTHTRQTLFVARFGRFALATASMELDFLPNTSKCLNFLSSGILVNVDSSRAASASTESESEHMQKHSYSDKATWYFLNPFSGSWCSGHHCY